jgi:hypothetical protein
MKLPKVALHWWLIGGVVALLIIQKSKTTSDAVIGGYITESGGSIADFRNAYKKGSGHPGGGYFRYLRQ